MFQALELGEWNDRSDGSQMWAGCVSGEGDQVNLEQREVAKTHACEAESEVNTTKEGH